MVRGGVGYVVALVVTLAKGRWQWQYILYLIVFVTHGEGVSASCGIDWEREAI